MRESSATSCSQWIDTHHARQVSAQHFLLPPKATRWLSASPPTGARHRRVAPQRRPPPSHSGLPIADAEICSLAMNAPAPDRALKEFLLLRINWQDAPRCQSGFPVASAQVPHRELSLDERPENRA